MNTQQFDELLPIGFNFHGHKCPAMPLGIRAGILAMEKLGVERASNKELFCIVESGPVHAMHCFVDGVQVATSCTFGKGTMEKTNYGKQAFTLIDVVGHKKIRIVVKPEFQQKGLASEFVQMRKQDIAPKDVPVDILNPMLERVRILKDEDLFIVGKVKESNFVLPKGTFNLIICDECGEGVFENAIKKVNGKHLCTTCAQKHVEVIG